MKKCNSLSFTFHFSNQLNTFTHTFLQDIREKWGFFNHVSKTEKLMLQLACLIYIHFFLLYLMFVMEYYVFITLLLSIYLRKDPKLVYKFPTSHSLKVISFLTLDLNLRKFKNISHFSNIILFFILCIMFLAINNTKFAVEILSLSYHESVYLLLYCKMYLSFK